MTQTLNTPENKARFFALYYGQKVMHNLLTFVNKETGIDPAWAIRASVFNEWPVNDESYLLLRSPASLTDAEAIEVARIEFSFFKECNFNIKVVRERSKISVAAIQDKICLAKIEINNPHKLNYRGIDYLRSIGILIGWLDLQPKQLKGYSWVKEVEG